MLPLNHKWTTSSFAPPIFCVAKKLAIKRYNAADLEDCKMTKINLKFTQKIIRKLKIHN